MCEEKTAAAASLTNSASQTPAKVVTKAPTEPIKEPAAPPTDNQAVTTAAAITEATTAEDTT